MSNAEIITKDDPIPTAHGGPEAPPTAAVTLFGSDDPAVVIERAQSASRALMGVVRSARLAIEIRGQEYLLVEAWQMLGSMVGVFASNVWTKPIKQGDRVLGWEARVEARTLSGAIVGAAEAMCLREEPRWAEGKAEEHMLRSMAQTRATSKALSMPLRFIAKLAGFSGTPAEEMPTEPRGKAAGRGKATTASQREPVEEIPGTDRPFRERDLCPACALDGNKTTRGGRPAFFIPKSGPFKGMLGCNGRIGEGPDAQWANHRAPISPQEAATADDNPANEAEIPA